MWKSIPPRARRSRQVTDPIEQLDAGSFISLTRQIKKKGKEKEGAWAGAAGGEMGTSEAPAPPAESAAGTGPWH